MGAARRWDPKWLEVSVADSWLLDVVFPEVLRFQHKPIRDVVETWLVIVVSDKNANSIL
jgi:hypothetical protein